jgi:hypothetical protein
MLTALNTLLCTLLNIPRRLGRLLRRITLALLRLRLTPPQPIRPTLFRLLSFVLHRNPPVLDFPFGLVGFTIGVVTGV